MTAFPLDILVKSSALLAAAALADRVMRARGSAAARHLLWSLTIAALLVLPIASLALPAWQVRVPILRASAAPSHGTGAALPNTAIATDAALRAAPVPASIPGEAEREMATPARSIATDEHGRTPFLSVFFRVLPWLFSAFVRVFPWLYAFGVILLLARLALEPRALRRLTRASSALTDPAWRRLLEDAAAHLGVARPVRLLRSAANVMPMTFGTLAPAIVVPASADAWTGDRRRAVLLHELAHVARGDCFVQRLTALACAIYWPHPGVWLAARRLRVERELACDDRVLAAGAPARAYAGHLLEIAHAFRAAPAPATALGMARAKQLEHRLLAILDEARNRAALGGARRRALVAVAIAVLLPIAALRASLVPADTDIETPAPQASAASGQELTGTWDLRPSGEPGSVQLSVRTGRSSHGRTVSLADVQVMTGNQITATTNASVHFPLRREAGTFTIDGVCRTGVCAGTYSFEPSAAYAADLEKRGIGRPAPQDQLALAMADVGAAYLDALAAAGYAKPDVRLLVRAAQHGVDLGYLKDMTSLGYKLGSLDPLIRLRDHGVDPPYIRGMAANGIKGLTADELVRTRDHGVDPEYIRGLASLGYTGLSVDTLVTARDHGVDPEYVRGMQGLGYKQTLDELRRTRDHGVDPEYVRGMQGHGYTGLTVDALVNARDHGVDPEYVRGMSDLGYKGVPLDQMVRMRDHGVDPEWVRRQQRNGATNLSVDELVRRRDRGGN